MQISALQINNFNINVAQNKICKKNITNPQKSIIPSFNGSTCTQKTDLDIKKLQEQEFFEEFLDKKGKVSKEEYRDIKTNHPSLLLKAQKFINMLYVGETTSQQMADIAIATSKFLNQEYKNYRIISLGTSPAPLTEQLENLGHDVIFLPISALDYCCDSLEMNALINYLKNQNLKDDKLNIVLDYISSGHTLSEMTDYIKNKFNLKEDSIKSLSLNDILKYIRATTRAWEYSKDMFDSSIENISNVPHFPVTVSGILRYKSANKAGTIYLNGLKENELFKEFDDYSTPLARCFSLCTMAEIDKIKRNGDYND